MNHKKEKTCPDAATSRQVKGIDFDKPVPQLNYTTESQKDNPAFLISDLLHYGRQNAVSRRTLARISGLIGGYACRTQCHDCGCGDG